MRNTLPFPSLTAAERRALAFWLGGIYWRMRGGGLIPLGATQDARWYFLEQPFTHIGELAGGQDGADAAFDIYLQIFEGWSDWQDMGNVQPGGDKYADLVSMTSRGQRQVGSAVTLLGGRSYDTLALEHGRAADGALLLLRVLPARVVSLGGHGGSAVQRASSTGRRRWASSARGRRWGWGSPRRCSRASRRGRRRR